MNLEKTLTKVQSYYDKSALLTYMHEFQRKLYVYPESVFELKPKQQAQLKKVADQLWPEHLKFAGTIHEYQNGIVLQGTDKNIPFLIEEAALFTNLLEFFNKEKQKTKQNQHLFKYYQDTFTEKPKDVLPLLLNDLLYLSETYDLGLVKEDLIKEYKKSLNQL